MLPSDIGRIGSSEQASPDRSSGFRRTWGRSARNQPSIALRPAAVIVVRTASIGGPPASTISRRAGTYGPRRIVGPLLIELLQQLGHPVWDLLA
jgi:hypothetical protein